MIVPQSTQNNYTPILSILQHSYSHTQQSFDSLKRTISGARLSTYQTRGDGSLVDAISLYQLNIALSQALYLPLQMLEVSLRNVISVSIENIFGSSWYHERKFSIILKSEKDWMRTALSSSISKASKQCDYKCKSLTSGDVVAQLTFAFWRELLKAQYDSHIWRKQLSAAFPNLPSSKSRQSIYDNVDKAVKLRNRISHHEPIIKCRLNIEYKLILEVLGWICLDTKEWTEYHSNFTDLYQKLPQKYNRKVEKPILRN